MRDVKKINDWQKDREPQFEFLPQTHGMIARRLKDGKTFASEGYKDFIKEEIKVDFCRVNIGEDFWVVIGCFQSDMIRITFTVFKGDVMTKNPFYLCDINYFEDWIYAPGFLEELKEKNP